MAERPALFADLSFDAAQAASKEQRKLLLVDATASWCQPCKHMDQTTWVDGKVTAAIGERAIAIQVDVDEEQPLAKKLAVRAMPTVIAFRDGAEVDRVVGVQAPAALVAWLDALARGETSLDVARKAAAEKPEDMHTRLAFARSLLEHGALDEATTAHTKLWRDLDASPSHLMVKHAVFEQQIGELVARHAPARDAFVRIRDAEEPGSRDWLTLNRVLKEPEKTIAWFETVRDRLRDDPELASVVEATVVPLLVEAGRWADAGHAIVSPMKTVGSFVEIRKRAESDFASLPPEDAKQAHAMLDMMAVQQLEILRRSLAAAGRDEELRAVEDLASKTNPAWLTPLPK